MGEQEEGWRARGRPEAEGEERKIARAQTRPESPPRFTVYFSRISSSSSSSTIFRAEPNLLFNREKEMMNSNRSPFSHPIFISPIESCRGTYYKNNNGLGDRCVVEIDDDSFTSGVVKKKKNEELQEYIYLVKYVREYGNFYSTKNIKRFSRELMRNHEPLQNRFPRTRPDPGYTS